MNEKVCDPQKSASRKNGEFYMQVWER